MGLGGSRMSTRRAGREGRTGGGLMGKVHEAAHGSEIDDSAVAPVLHGHRQVGVTLTGPKTYAVNQCSGSSGSNMRSVQAKKGPSRKQ